MSALTRYVKISDDPEGDKYELTDHYMCSVPVNAAERVTYGLVTLYATGTLAIFRGYQWDGASGPTLDTKSNMRAALVHDALYDLLRSGLLGKAGSRAWKRNRKLADGVLRDFMRADGAPWWRAQYYYWAVRMFAGRHAK
jgi:hypothetical protein